VPQCPIAGDATGLRNEEEKSASIVSAAEVREITCWGGGRTTLLTIGD
jgi:hypothetical protein